MNEAPRGRCGRYLRLTLWLALAALLPPSARAESIEEKAEFCAACHGDNGVPLEQASPVPVIWGQQLGYLFFELRDFKSGARKNEQMTPIAQGLEPADLMALAQYFSKKAWPDLQQPAAAAAADAQRVNASVVCTSCHQEGFKGDSTQPRLAGQVRAYLQKTMMDFRSGERGNNPGMTGFMKGLTEQEIAAMAAWLAGM
ncbi:MAG TPA: c-type cytochrome [Xanthobacteraceae bacterium]|nr:c-type cytochrome [Xanthobacteraceae bacterium]